MSEVRKMKVYYKGDKNKMSLALPVGCKSRSSILGYAEFIKGGEPIEFSEHDARLLCEKLDSHNFEHEDQRDEQAKSNEEQKAVEEFKAKREAEVVSQPKPRRRRKVAKAEEE